MPINHFKKIIDSEIDKLSKREEIVISSYYGLNSESKKTLVKIGKELKITRERVRQIKNIAIDKLRENIKTRELALIIKTLQNKIKEYGGAVCEAGLCNISNAFDKKTRSYVSLLIDISDEFIELKYRGIKKSYTTSQDDAKRITKALDKLNIKIQKSPQKLYTKKEVLKLVDLDVTEEKKMKILDLSEIVKKNKNEDYGHKTHPYIALKKLDDCVRFIFLNLDEPLHFHKIADKVNDLLNDKEKKITTKTCHNFLVINDDFILVGRGLYASADSKYSGETVMDVVRNYLKKQKSATKAEIIRHVNDVKVVKKNTIIQALNNRKCFTYDKKQTVYSNK